MNNMAVRALKLALQIISPGSLDATHDRLIKKNTAMCLIV